MISRLMSMEADEDDLGAHKADSVRYTKELESTSKLTISTAPLTPPTHDSHKDDYDKSVPTSNSTLSSAQSGGSEEDPPLSTCSSPYDAFLFSSEWLGSRELPQLQLPEMISSVSSRGAGVDDDAESVASGAYFDPVDLDSSNWMRAIRMDGPTFGFAMVALATALVHPVLFVAGALTAFGTLQAVGAGYEYCSKTGGDSGTSEGTAASWESCMLSICFKQAPQQPNTGKDQVEEKTKDLRLAEPGNKMLLLPVASATEASSAGLQIANGSTAGTVETATWTQEQEVKQVPAEDGKAFKKTKPLSNELIEQMYPPLANTVVKGVSFPGLHAIEFFRVFFADDAPYNFMELQKQRGDLNIVYSNWRQLGDEEPVSLDGGKGKPKKWKKQQSLLEDWKSSFQGRVLSFKAKTNNFIGPMFATTRKTQRVLLHHKTMIVMESRTDLSDIPFCDRFYVLERWIIRAEKILDEAASGQKPKYKYVSTLDATSGVVFSQSCQFASQIKSKSASTIQDLVKCWCTMAKEALKLTEQRKSLRLKHEQEGDSEVDCYETDLEEENSESNKHEQCKGKPRTHEEEGVEMIWPEKDASIATESATGKCRPELRHSGSAPLPTYRGRRLQSFKRSVSSLWKNGR